MSTAAGAVLVDSPSAADDLDLMVRIYCCGNLHNDFRYKIDYYSYHID